MVCLGIEIKIENVNVLSVFRTRTDSRQLLKEKTFEFPSWCIWIETCKKIDAVKNFSKHGNKMPICYNAQYSLFSNVMKTNYL